MSENNYRKRSSAFIMRQYTFTLTPRCTVLPQTLVVPQLVKKIPRIL